MKQIKSRKSQRGVSLLELALCLVLLSGVTILEIQDAELEAEQQMAKDLGMDLFKYNSYVSQYVERFSGDDSAATLVGARTGVDWLKSTTCGGDLEFGIAPCEFLSNKNGLTSFGDLSFTTNITQSDEAGLRATTTMSELAVGGEARSDLAGVAVLIASSVYSINNASGSSGGNSTQIVFCPNIDGMSTSFSSLCMGAKGKIRSYVSHQPKVDVYLRTDHGNVMRNTLEMGNSVSTRSQITAIDSNLRQIRNVSRIYNLNDASTNDGNDNLFLGKGNASGLMATLANGGVIIDADNEVLGELRTRLDASFDKDVSVANQLSTIDGNIISKNGDIFADTDGSAGGDLVAGDDLLVGGDAKIASDFNVAGSLRALKDLKVSDDVKLGSNLDVNNESLLNGNVIGSSFRVIQDRISEKNVSVAGLNVVYGDTTIGGNDSTGGLIKSTGGVQSLNGDIVVNSGFISGESYYDVDNGTDLNFGGEVTFNKVESSLVRPMLIAQKNTSCVEQGNGTIARLANGKAMSCVGGIWKNMTLDYTDTPMRCETVVSGCSPGGGLFSAGCSSGPVTITGLLGQTIPVLTGRRGSYKNGYEYSYAYFTCTTTGRFKQTAG
jgi:hypothetical protein